MITYLSWWYAQEPLYLWRSIKIVTKKIYLNFSITTLLRTLFDPWKRDVMAAENASLNVRFNILIGNLVSRLVGFVLRFFTIWAGLITTIGAFFIMVALFLIWLFLPILILFLMINGIRVIFNG
ncbi:MAG: hypothetical protein ABSE91_00380 [Patescibacteria group bacterium]|jgi:hypothetical protein